MLLAALYRHPLQVCRRNTTDLLDTSKYLTISRGGNGLGPFADRADQPVKTRQAGSPAPILTGPGPSRAHSLPDRKRHTSGKRSYLSPFSQISPTPMAR